MKNAALRAALAAKSPAQLRAILALADAGWNRAARNRRVRSVRVFDAVIQAAEAAAGPCPLHS